jgi:hypothetical protein
MRLRASDSRIQTDKGRFIVKLDPLSWQLIQDSRFSTIMEPINPTLRKISIEYSKLRQN